MSSNNNNETAVNNTSGGGGYQSPRTALQHELVAFSYEVVDLVLNIYDNRLEEIKDIFHQKGGQLGPVRACSITHCIAVHSFN